MRTDWLSDPLTQKSGLQRTQMSEFFVGAMVFVVVP